MVKMVRRTTSSQPTPAASIATFRFRIAPTVWPWRSSATSEKSRFNPSWPAKWTTRAPSAIATWLKPGAGCSPGGLTSSRVIGASFRTGDERDELVVGDETLLARAETLDLGEELGVAIGRDVQPEPLHRDADRVEPALLTEHDSPLGAHELRGVRLDRGRVVELRRDRPGLAREERVARD